MMSKRSDLKWNLYTTRVVSPQCLKHFDVICTFIFCHLLSRFFIGYSYYKLNDLEIFHINYCY